MKRNVLRLWGVGSDRMAVRTYMGSWLVTVVKIKHGNMEHWNVAQKRRMMWLVK